MTSLILQTMCSNLSNKKEHLNGELNSMADELNHLALAVP